MPENASKSGWRRHRFDEMAVIVNDRIDDPAVADVEYYVGLEHLDSESLTIRRWGSPSDVEATKLRFRAGDIIFGRRRVYQRKLAVANFDGICSAHAMVLRAKPEVALPEFLPFFMQSDLFMERAKEISVGSLSPTINWKTLAKEEFALPPLEEQAQIVDLLTLSYNSAEALLMASDSALVVRRATQNELLFESSAESTAGMFRMGDIAHINPTDPPLDAGAPFVPMDAVTEWQRTIEITEKRGNRGGVRARAGDVLMARITPCLENGKVAQVPESIPRCGGSTEFIVFRSRQHSDHSYIYWLLTADRIRNTVIALMSGTTGRQRVSGRDLSDILIPEIPAKRRQQIGRLIDSIEQCRIELVKRLKQARILHFKILNSLVGRGET